MSLRALAEAPLLGRVLALLNGDGEEARVVGGAVRNALLDRPLTDYDVTTTALPTTVIARAKASGLRTIPTGIAHGTVTLMVDGRPFEVTTLREDVETDGRHAIVRFGRDFAQDALRRDFTINALSMSADGTLHDYAGGLDDIKARRVRFIGDPARRIAEDYLRILRFFRFTAEYAEGPLDPQGLAASIHGRGGLAHLSRERVRNELLKLLAARGAIPVVTAMAESGLLGPQLCAVPQPARCARLVAIAPDADALLRLAGLAAIVPEDARRLRDVLRLSNAETTRLEGVTRVRSVLHGRDQAPPPDVLRGLLFDVGRQVAREGLLLAWAESRAAPDDAGWCAALRFLHDTPEPRLPFSGVDLIARGIAPGPPLGLALKRLQANWIKAGYPREPHALASLLDEVSSRTE